MADSFLTALKGLRYDPFATYEGMAAKGIGDVSGPLLQSAEGTGQKLGVTVGSLLLSSLLGRMAVNRANERTLENQKFALTLDAMTPEQRIAALETVEDPISRRSLIDYNANLRAQEVGLTAQIQNKLKEIEALSGAEQRAAAEFYETPLGKAAFEAELKRTEKLADARRIAEDPLDLMKREGDFYRTPEGAQYWNEYIQRQEQLGKTKRIGIEDYAAREKAKTEEINKRDKAKNDLDVQKKITLGAIDNQQKIELEKALNEAEMKAIREGGDAETERGKILAQFRSDKNLDEIIKRSDLAKERSKYAADLVLRAENYKKKLERDYPTVSAKMKDDFARAYGTGIVGLQLAEDIENEASRADILTARNAFTAGLGNTAEINVRLQAFVNEYRSLVTGQAAAEAELARIESVIKGSVAASPQEVAMRIREIVASARTKTTEALAASTMNLDTLVKRVRENPLDRGGFDVQVPEVGAKLQEGLQGASTSTGKSEKRKKFDNMKQELEDLRKSRGARENQGVTNNG